MSSEGSINPTRPIQYSNSLLSIIEDPYEVAEPGSHFLRFHTTPKTDNILANILLHIHRASALSSYHQQRVDVTGNGNGNGTGTGTGTGNGQDEDAVVLVVSSNPSSAKGVIAASVGTYVDESQTLTFQILNENCCTVITMVFDSDNIINIQMVTSKLPSKGASDIDADATETKEVEVEVGVLIRVQEGDTGR